MGCFRSEDDLRLVWTGWKRALITTIDLVSSQNGRFLFLPYGSFPIRRLYQQLLRKWVVAKGAKVRLVKPAFFLR